MLYTAKIENKNGEVIELTQDENNWQVVSITGLNPPPAQVNLTPIAGLDGSVFNSAKLDTRELVILMRINGDAEENRLTLYRFSRTKEPCRFYYKSSRRDVFIDGYIQTAEANLFEQGQVLQISVICPQPYFRSMDEIIEDISSTAALFVFPFSIDYGEPVPFSSFDVTRATDVFNTSEAETGVDMEAFIHASVSKLYIVNTTTGEWLELDYSFQSGDRVLIDTVKGEKSLRLVRSGSTYNLFPALKAGSKFFQLQIGSNLFEYLADEGASNQFVNIIVKRRDLFRGV